MQFSLKAKGFEMTDAIRAYVDEKMAMLEKKVSRFGESVTGEVEVGRTSKHHKKGEVFRAEIHVRLPRKLVYAEALHKNLYTAITAAKREAESQIAAYKSGLAEKKRDGRKREKGV